jgi:hypothetical protein
LVVTRGSLSLENLFTNYLSFDATSQPLALLDTKHNLKWLDKKYAFFGIPQSAIDNNPKI